MPTMGRASASSDRPIALMNALRRKSESRHRRITSALCACLGSWFESRANRPTPRQVGQIVGTGLADLRIVTLSIISELQSTSLRLFLHIHLSNRPKLFQSPGMYY